jgi:mannose-1-phosphate guanylyltransferase
VFTVRSILAAFNQHLPATSGALDCIRANPNALSDVWSDTDATSIDFGVMERSDNVLTVPCDFGWSDLGAWDDVGLLWPEVPGGRGRARRVVAVGSDGCVVHALDKAVALVGLQGIVVVDTPDALLVVDRRHAQDVRAALKQLQELGESSLL